MGRSKKLLGEGRKDKSGDFTKGANLKISDIKTLEETLNKKTPETVKIFEIFKIFKDYNLKILNLIHQLLED